MVKSFTPPQCTDNQCIEISVVIPCFNSVNTIGRALESIFSQKQLPTKVIVVDDCSTDGTPDFIRQSYSEQTNTGLLQLHVLEYNSGPSVARQKGIELCDTPYITFVDADDCYLSDDVFLQISPILQQQLPDFLMFKYKTRHGNVTLSKDFKVFPEGLYSSREAMIAKVNVSDPPIWHYLWNKVYKTNIITDYSITFNAYRKSGEDVAFNDDYLAVSSNVYFLDKFFYLYDCNSSASLTRNRKTTDANPTFEQYSMVWKQELERYEKLVANSQRLGCFDECAGQLRRDFCMYLFKTERSTRQYDFYSDLKNLMRQFSDYEATIKYLPSVKRKYLIDRAKGRLRLIAKSLVKVVLKV